MKQLAATYFGIVLVVFLLLTPAGCRKNSADKSPEDRGQVQTKATDANNGAQGAVLAIVDGEQITEDVLEDAMFQIPERSRPRVRGRILEGIIEARVFANEARKMGLAQDPKVQKSMEKITNEVLAQTFVKRYIDQPSDPSEEEIRSYYDNHKDQFLVPDGVEIQEVQAKDRKLVEDAQKALKDGKSFGDVASKYSRARSRFKAGSAGWVYKGKMDPALEKVVLGMEKGEVSGIIEGQKGYLIVKVLDKEAEHYMSLEKSKTKIRFRFFGKKRQEILDQYYEKAKVDKHPSEKGAFVKIGEEIIPESYVKEQIGKVPTEEKLRERWAKYLIDTRLFSQEARKVHLEKDPQVLRELKRREDRILANIFRKEIIAAKTEISDQEVAEYYESHRDAFQAPLKVRLKGILVKTREEAEEVLEDLKFAVSFAQIAIDNSIRPDAAANGGSIGWFGKGELDPALEEVAFSLEEGQVSGIIETAEGYEIIKLMKRRGGDTKPLEQVKQEIKMKFMVERLEEEKKRYFKTQNVKILVQDKASNPKATVPPKESTPKEPE
jgi:EpsD family peptidyl-prolyl cis-trans isomerase